jgi:hypothetical protein
MIALLKRPAAVAIHPPPAHYDYWYGSKIAKWENSEMVEKASSLALSFPCCQFTILHTLIAILIATYGLVAQVNINKSEANLKG